MTTVLAISRLKRVRTYQHYQIQNISTPIKVSLTAFWARWKRRIIDVSWDFCCQDLTGSDNNQPVIWSLSHSALDSCSNIFSVARIIPGNLNTAAAAMPGPLGFHAKVVPFVLRAGTPLSVLRVYWLLHEWERRSQRELLDLETLHYQERSGDQNIDVQCMQRAASPSNLQRKNRIKSLLRTMNLTVQAQNRSW